MNIIAKQVDAAQQSSPVLPLPELRHEVRLNKFRGIFAVVVASITADTSKKI